MTRRINHKQTQYSGRSDRQAVEQNQGQDSNSGQKCKDLSRRVEVLCGILIFSELALLAHAVSGADWSDSFTEGLTVTMCLTWIIWIVTQIENYRLVRCGPHAHRYSVAARTINRPEFPFRMTYHLLINWSAIAATLIAGFIVGNGALADTIGYICIVSVVVAWLVFNLLHRRVNRIRNLALSSTIAFVLIMVATALISR